MGYLKEIRKEIRERTDHHKDLSRSELYDLTNKFLGPRGQRQTSPDRRQLKEKHKAEHRNRLEKKKDLLYRK